MHRAQLGWLVVVRVAGREAVCGSVLKPTREIDGRTGIVQAGDVILVEQAS